MILLKRFVRVFFVVKKKEKKTTRWNNGINPNSKEIGELLVILRFLLCRFNPLV